MPSPAYAWVVDDQGNEVKSNCKVADREGALEILAFDYGVQLPTDHHTGASTGTRKHNVAKLTKAYCPASPILFDAACHGKTLQSVTIKWYQIDDNGKEAEYFTHILENVKVVSYEQKLRHVKDNDNDKHVHEDEIALRFSKITMKHHDGNIEASDEWNVR